MKASGPLILESQLSIEIVTQISLIPKYFKPGFFQDSSAIIFRFSTKKTPQSGSKTSTWTKDGDG